MKPHENQFRCILVFSLRYNEASKELSGLATPATGEEKAPRAPGPDVRRKFDEIYYSNDSRVFRYIQKRVLISEVEDLCQKVWIICYENILEGKQVDNWSSFLIGTAKNLIWDYIRTKTKDVDRTERMANSLDSGQRLNGKPVFGNTEMELITQEILDAIDEAVERLPRDERAAWLLKYGPYDQRNINRIVALVSKPEDYVRARMQTTDNGRQFISEDNAAEIMGITKSKYVTLVRKANQRIADDLRGRSWSGPLKDLLNG
jgi:RNA polymerase sigma factor (sigma-70 family)